MSENVLTLQEWVKTSPADDFWIWPILLIVATVVCFFLAFSYLQRKRVIQDTPTSRIRSAAQGYIELVGHGHLMEGQPIVSPLTGKSCTWYEYKVEERRTRGSGDNRRTEWVTVKKGISEELFLIKDETGQCVIDPEGAKVTVTDKQVWYGRSIIPPSYTNIKPGLVGKLGSGLMSGVGSYRYTEKLLYPGESLYAIGFYKTVGGSGASLNVNDDVRELIREWKSDTEAMMKKFDTNKDGQLDMDEWQKLREEAYSQVMKNHKEHKLLPPVNLMEKTNDRRRPYILSAVPEDDLTRKLHLFSVLSISVFIIAGSLATWLVSVRLAV